MLSRFTKITIAAAVAATLGAGSVAQAVPLFALSADNDIFTLDSSAPATIIGGASISGLAANEKIVAIDARPATGQLYGVGSSSRVYTINPTTGLATAVAGTSFTPSLNGVNFDMDFNPTVDRFRVVSDTDQNLRLNPITGLVVAIDGNEAYTGPLAIVNPNIAGIAYTNNFAGATTTVLYAIDSGTDTLSIQDANAGTLIPVGVGLGFDVTAILGFDIYTVGGVNTALAVMQTTGNTNSQLYTINLATGQATPAGQIGGGFVVRDLTVAIPEPASLAFAGLAAVGMIARRRRA